jgi:hypothetical protein
MVTKPYPRIKTLYTDFLAECLKLLICIIIPEKQTSHMRYQSGRAQSCEDCVPASGNLIRIFRIDVWPLIPAASFPESSIRNKSVVV